MKDKPHGPVSERFMRHHYGAAKGAPAGPDPIEQLRHTVATLIVWMAQSATSPISVENAETLLKLLPPERK
jgi:hypothetical protein